MQKQTKLEEILRAFDETLRPLYLECEAGFAEDLQCEIARKAVFLLETERKEAVEGFARWWNVHGGKGEEFITRNSWREYKEHLTQTEGDKKCEHEWVNCDDNFGNCWLHCKKCNLTPTNRGDTK